MVSRVSDLVFRDWGVGLWFLGLGSRVWVDRQATGALLWVDSNGIGV